MTEQPITEPAWLRAKIDQRLALMNEKFPVNERPAGAIITTFLTEPTDGNFDEWDRTCDNCETVFPRGTLFYTGNAKRRLGDHQVVITFGVCDSCKDLP